MWGASKNSKNAIANLIESRKRRRWGLFVFFVLFYVHNMNWSFLSYFEGTCFVKDRSFGSSVRQTYLGTENRQFWLARSSMSGRKISKFFSSVGMGGRHTSNRICHEIADDLEITWIKDVARQFHDDLPAPNRNFLVIKISNFHFRS